MIVNSPYLKPEWSKKIKEIFLNERKVILFDFFEQECYRKLKTEIKTLPFAKESNPLTHSYAHATLSPHLRQVFNSHEFLNCISLIINTKTTPVLLKMKALCFSWKDYIILHDENKEKLGIDIIVDCTEDWNEKAGGNVVYVDGKGNYSKIPVKENTLTIVKRHHHEQKFVQYVNHYAGPKKRYLVVGKLC